MPGNALRAYLDGGRIVVRSGHIPENLPDQVAASDLTPGELEEIMPASTAAARSLAVDPQGLLPHRFYALTPNAKNPYQRFCAVNWPAKGETAARLPFCAETGHLINKFQYMLD